VNMLSRHLYELLLIALVALVCIATGCSSHLPRTQPTSSGTQEPAESRLRTEQLEKLWAFDKAMATISPDCDVLCGLHTKICTLSTQICNMDDAQKTDGRVRRRCETATQTCRKTTKRIPDTCWCFK
jgi:hypothetical protein